MPASRRRPGETEDIGASLQRVWGSPDAVTAHLKKLDNRDDW